MVCMQCDLLVYVFVQTIVFFQSERFHNYLRGCKHNACHSFSHPVWFHCHHQTNRAYVNPPCISMFNFHLDLKSLLSLVLFNLVNYYTDILA